MQVDSHVPSGIKDYCKGEEGLVCLLERSVITWIDSMAFKSKSSPKRNFVTQLHDYLNKYVTYDSDVCSYELISLSSSIPVKEFSISLLAAEI